MTKHQVHIVFAGLALVAAAVSLFLPFEIREAHSYMPVFGFSRGFYERTELSGFDLVSPLISLGLIFGMFLLLLFGKSLVARIVVLGMSALNCLALVLILVLMHNRFQLFGNDMPISTGFGFHVLSFASLLMVILASIQLIRPNELRAKKEGAKKAQAVDVIDDL